MQRGAGGAGLSRPRDGGTGGGRAHGPGDGLRDDAGTLLTRTPGGRDQRCRDPPHEDPGADGCDGETHVFSQFLFNDSSVPGDPRRQAERDQTGGRATHCPADGPFSGHTRRCPGPCARQASLSGAEAHGVMSARTASSPASPLSLSLRRRAHEGGPLAPPSGAGQSGRAGAPPPQASAPPVPSTKGRQQRARACRHRGPCPRGQRRSSGLRAEAGPPTLKQAGLAFCGVWGVDAEASPVPSPGLGFFGQSDAGSDQAGGIHGAPHGAPESPGQGPLCGLHPHPAWAAGTLRLAYLGAGAPRRCHLTDRSRPVKALKSRGPGEPRGL